MKLICPHDTCSGCQACRLTCPKQCISMKEDDRGNIYPDIDATLCIDCKRCQKVCPSLNPPSFSERPIKVYAGWAKDTKARMYSTSGAISYVLSKYFLSEGNAFCGAIWNGQGAEHRVTTSLENIKLFQGSKYAHSDVKECYQQICELLISGKKVLFTGTPCQCAALRNYIGAKNTPPHTVSYLYVVDIVCHGVPSNRILREHLCNIERQNGKSVVEMRFREKTPTQINTSTKYTFEDGSVYQHSVHEDFFFRSFVDNYILRDNCYQCSYSQIKRVSDITIADFWGYSPKRFRFRDYEKGVSIIIINTDKGQELFNQVKSQLKYEERDIKENYNQNLHAPQVKPKD